jgi:adenine-specific DNA methylase
VKAIEGDFPFEYISEVAEIESWRKELYRPIYHMHKWWARRLGTVFRAVILGAFFDEPADIMQLLYEPVDLDGVVIFDPFMGS